MGNNQSSAQNECPSPFCKALCFGSPPNSDEGEWFGDLPKDKNKRRKTRKRREPKRLPSVPEEGTTCSDTVDTEESSSVLSPPSISRTTSKSIDEGGDEVVASRPNLERRNTEPASRVVKLPKTKLTFVNGQFVDVSTEEGRTFAEMFDAREEDVDGSSSDVSVRGVEVSPSMLYYLRIGPLSCSMKIQRTHQTTYVHLLFCRLMSLAIVKLYVNRLTRVEVLAEVLPLSRRRQALLLHLP